MPKARFVGDEVYMLLGGFCASKGFKIRLPKNPDPSDPDTDLNQLGGDNRSEESCMLGCNYPKETDDYCREWANVLLIADNKGLVEEETYLYHVSECQMVDEIPQIQE